MAKSLNGRTLIWAHRGASAYAPENTMEAFRLAMDMKADGVEIDVHMTKDGRIVIIHDEKIDRVSNGQGKVTDYNFDELLAFDFGYRFYGERRGVKIPALEELYTLFAGTGMTVNVEIKSQNPAIIKPLHELAIKYGMADFVHYSSFDHEQLARMKRQFPETSIAPLYGTNLVKAWLYCENLGASASHPIYRQLDLYPEYVDECHARGIKVNPWTVDDPELAKKLVDAGVDAIITNRPDLLF